MFQCPLPNVYVCLRLHIIGYSVHLITTSDTD